MSQRLYSRMVEWSIALLLAWPLCVWAALPEAFEAVHYDLDVTYDDPVRPVEGNYARTLGVTALMVAAHFGQLDVAKRLVEAGADLYVESHWPDGAHRRNAFDYAVEGKQLEVARYLWSKGGGMRLGARLPWGEIANPRCFQALPEAAE